MFWHELVLAGVGGRTITEAKAAMTYNEAQAWWLYMQERGTLSLGQRIDEMAARIAHMLAAVNGVKNAKFEDYLPERAKYKKKKEKVDLKQTVPDVKQLASMLKAQQWKPKKKG